MTELLHLAEELRVVFADERRAIAALDHQRLARLADQKRAIASTLGELVHLASESPAARELFSAIRVEAHANALLAAAATEAVRALLGYDTGGGYDRRARRVGSQSTRILATY